LLDSLLQEIDQYIETHKIYEVSKHYIYEVSKH